MNKILLLSKSHIRKNKGVSVGILLLIIIMTLMLNSCLMLAFDVYPKAEKETERLHGGDGFFRVTGDVEKLGDDEIADIFEAETDEYFAYDCLDFLCPVTFGNGELVLDNTIVDSSAFSYEMAYVEPTLEDLDITENYIYLPYQFYTGGGYKTGDDFSIKINGQNYDYKVRGFIYTGYMGCNNTGDFIYVLDDASYEELKASYASSNSAKVIIYDLADGVKHGKFRIDVSNRIINEVPNAEIGGLTAEDNNSNRGFMSLIIAVSFGAVSAIIILVIIMMLANCISNYIKEEMKTMGALKAIGYTSKDLKTSVLLQFTSIALIGSIVGLIISYLMMPLFISFSVNQMGVKINVDFVPAISIAVLLISEILIVLTSLAVTRKLKKIEPIIALRNGVESHNFKKNRVRLDRSSSNVNLALAMKTMIQNKRQNLITFFVTGMIIFICTIALLMMVNFNLDLNVDLLTTETCNAVIVVEHNDETEVEAYLYGREDIRNIRRVHDVSLFYNSEEQLYATVFDDTSKISNQNVCYQGDMASYDNEICISGKFARDYGFKIGDDITMQYGDMEATYLITGLIQTSNNSGREAIMSEAAMERLISPDSVITSYYFDCDKADTDRILGEIEDEFGTKIKQTVNFDKIIEGSATTFKTLSSLMLTVICVTSAAVIFLILYLLIKSLIYSKRQDFGVYKAIGYTSSNLIYQIAVSFMPPIILSVIVFSFVSYHLANPYMNIVMMSFGIVKASFKIPIPGMILIGGVYILLSLFFAILQARRVKNIEPYKMLIAE